ncbi:dihydropteroate synthase [Rhodoferax lacus]|uniref:Dihydropteroate synthase n=1 Tax=Rhodoferax lacus TaxID=2184758 RepID=A0A3E1RC66_9BURK|nr:dihydropteroate synthase [Rhodoferax lacus]RFO96958.1 dihydropteroate synthase [Rhodoferax lacus]
MHWQTSRFLIDLSRPQVMGIVNVTPDSFSDGGHFATHPSAMAHCEQLLKDGADILDIGGESTRPGAPAVPEEVELARVLPVLRHAVTLGVPVSVDTYKPAVMRAALELGADIINDIWALRWQGDSSGQIGSDVVRSHATCGVCLMHMHREPQTMQTAPMEGDVVPQVTFFLQAMGQQLREQGVDARRICLDPGIGFGKTVQQNFALLARQAELLPLGYPVLAGWSRKSSLAAVTQTAPAQVASVDAKARMVPSVVAALLAVQNGAAIVRVHDVAETVQALKVLAAMQAAGT